MIREDLKRRSTDALRARDRETRTLLANVLARFTEAEKSVAFAGWDEASEVAIIQAHVKSLKKSIEAMEGTDLAAQYEREIALVADYLPQTMSEATARPLLEPLAAKANGRLGPFMGMVMKTYPGKIEPGLARKIGEDLGLS